MSEPIILSPEDYKSLLIKIEQQAKSIDETNQHLKQSLKVNVRFAQRIDEQAKSIDALVEGLEDAADILDGCAEYELNYIGEKCRAIANKFKTNKQDKS